MSRAVFLDRDGVLNRAVVRDGKPFPPNDASSVEITSGGAEALTQLKRRGFLLIVVTNQPDVARGTQSIEIVRQIHARLAADLPIDDFFVCCHDDADDCSCRKPRPGLLFDAATLYGIDLSRSFLIGDRWRDIDAGHAAGCTTVFIDYGYRERAPSTPPGFTAADLPGAVRWILMRCAMESNVPANE